ncbi:MAG: hypothetical protein FJ403_02435 [Verrucomicrobia bacterium]|nr:hypothetical protein [Verrucomicrobiota bacterium]
MALSPVLLTGSRLLINSFIRLHNVDTGYRAEHVLTVPLSLTHPKYTNSNVAPFIDQLLDWLAALPGIQHAALTSWAPIAGGSDRFEAAFQIEGSLAKSLSQDAVASGCRTRLYGLGSRIYPPAGLFRISNFGFGAAASPLCDLCPLMRRPL